MDSATGAPSQSDSDGRSRCLPATDHLQHFGRAISGLPLPAGNAAVKTHHAAHEQQHEPIRPASRCSSPIMKRKPRPTRLYAMIARRSIIETIRRPAPTSTAMLTAVSRGKAERTARLASELATSATLVRAGSRLAFVLVRVVAADGAGVAAYVRERQRTAGSVGVDIVAGSHHEQQRGGPVVRGRNGREAAVDRDVGPARRRCARCINGRPDGQGRDRRECLRVCRIDVRAGARRRFCLSAKAGVCPPIGRNSDLPSAGAVADRGLDRRSAQERRTGVATPVSQVLARRRQSADSQIAALTSEARALASIVGASPSSRALLGDL